MYRYELSPIGLLMCVYAAVDRSNFRHLEEAIRTASRDGTRVIVSVEDCATIDTDGIAVFLRAQERLNDRIQIVARTGTQTFDQLRLAGIVDVTTTGPLPPTDAHSQTDPESEPASQPIAAVRHRRRASSFRSASSASSDDSFEIASVGQSARVTSNV